MVEGHDCLVIHQRLLVSQNSIATGRPPSSLGQLHGRVYFVLMHETVYPELSGTHHFLENSADHHCIIILHHQDTVVIQTQAKSTENSKLHMPLFGEFGRSSRDLCHYGGYNAMNPGTIGWIRPKVASEFSNFKRLKNREDGSNFDDFCMKTFASTQTFFSKNFAPL